MAIYEIEKLKDGLHVQDESPNPQIYALFKMGQELEQQGGGGGGGGSVRTTIPFNSFAAYKANVMDKLNPGDEVIFNFDITVDFNKTIFLSGEPYTYIANKNFKGHATCVLNDYNAAIISRIRIDDEKIFSGLIFGKRTVSAGQIACENFSFNTNDDFRSFSGVAYIYNNS